MIRDLVDQMGDTGRKPRALSDDDDNTVERVSLHDLTMALHYDTGKAVFVSETGEEKRAQWLPRSAIEIESTGKTVKGAKRDGTLASFPLVNVTAPEWLLKSKGLI